MYNITFMKWILSILLILMITGICTAQVPDLVGNWTGSEIAYIAENGTYKLLEDGSVRLVISDQKDRLFTGYLTYSLDGKDIVESFAGTIGLDNRMVHIAELNDGYDFGTIISNDEIELIYLADGENGRAAIEKLYRMSA